MRKFALLFLTICFLGMFYPMTVHGTDYAVEMIPEDAIRLRILANSNDMKDQQMKYTVRDEVNAYLSTEISQVTSIDEARKRMEEILPKVEEIITKTLEQKGENLSFSVQFKKDVPFPTKKYGKYVYPAGDYEALLITLGEGEGDNWWCVLFPSLCYLDLSKEEKAEMEQANKEEEKTEKKTVKIFLFEWLGLT